VCIYVCVWIVEDETLLKRGAEYAIVVAVVVVVVVGWLYVHEHEVGEVVWIVEVMQESCMLPCECEGRQEPIPSKWNYPRSPNPNAPLKLLLSSISLFLFFTTE
jgi:hypothetical protein